MDILKVLSRGTKRNSKSSTAPLGGSVTLSSAGACTNPQLFHDDVRGHKRKRDDNAGDNGGEGGDGDSGKKGKGMKKLPEVDFFAPRKSEADKVDVDVEARRAASPVAQPIVRLCEDECRQVLRSHRLKLTLLSGSRQEERQVSKATTKTKKKEKEKEKEKVKDKEKHDLGKTQLFPQPLTSFSQLRSTYDISRRVSENIAAQGFRVPTEVQLGSLPLLLRPETALGGQDGLQSGSVDFLAVAPTGSGKTISFLIPAINSIMRRRALQKPEGPRELEAVIVAPTRELVHQIANETRKLCRGTGLKVVAMRKDMRVGVAADTSRHAETGGEDDNDDDDDKDEQESQSDHQEQEPEKAPRRVTQADILVTTPLLLSRSIANGSSLGSVHELVLDEADVLLDPLFREPTVGIWTACSNPELRTSCWSATMGSNIESLVVEQLRSRAEAMDMAPKPLIRLVVGLKDTAVPNIVHKLIYTASEQGKLLALRQLLHPSSSGGRDDSGPPLRPPFLVFTQTIDRATGLYEELKYDIPIEAGGATRLAALHGGLSDGARAALMRRFRAGEIWVLITTDVLARGVDFAGVNGVVNYDVPGSSAGYVHRAGRTGRAGREGGVAVTFYTKDDIPFVKTVANVIAASERQAAGATTTMATKGNSLQAGRGDQEKAGGVQKWLLDVLPRVAKADRKKLKERGVESRRHGSKAKISSKSGYEQKRENNRRGAMEANRRRRRETGAQAGAEAEEWTGFAD